MDSLPSAGVSATRAFDLGCTRFSPRRVPLRIVSLHDDLAHMRALLREQCPQLPGIYTFFDAEERLVYVGLSIDLRKRLTCYFTARTADVKERRIARSAVRVGWEPAIHALSANLRELELIRRFKPRFNVKGQDQRFRTGYVFLTTEEAPRFRADKLLPRGCRRSWGPLPLGHRTRSAVDRLNYAFGLRDCSQDTSMRFSDQASLFEVSLACGCLRGETGTCAAPCAGRCTRSAYNGLVEEACQLLDGESMALLRLEIAIAEAATNRRFEYAASLRDTYLELSYLREQLDTLQRLHRDYWFVYPVTGASGREYWYIVAGGVIRQVLPSPMALRSGMNSEKQSQRARRCLQVVEDTLEQQGRDVNTADLPPMFLLASWFRKHPAEYQRVIPLVDAQQACVAMVA